MLHIAIVDDDEIVHQQIRDILLKEDFDYRVDDYFSIQDIKDFDHIDLMLLDIEMREIDGITFSKNNHQLPIIFVTHHSERVREAFGPHIFGYILKEYLELELMNKIQSVIDYLELYKKIEIVTDEGIMQVELHSILYIEYLSRKRLAIVTEEKVYYVHSSIQEISLKLGKNFLFIDRSIIVNVEKIDYIKGYELKMKDINRRFHIVKARKKEVFQKWMEKVER